MVGTRRMQLFFVIRACVFLSIPGYSSSYFTPPAAASPRASGPRAGPPTGLPQASTAAAAAVAPLAAADSDAEAFERVTLARRSTKHFDRRRPVPDDVLKKVMRLA